MQGLVAIRRDVGFDAFGVHDAAIGQHDGHLLGEERIFRVAELHLRLAAFERADERCRIFRRDFLVERALARPANLNCRALGRRVHLDQRSLAA